MRGDPRAGASRRATGLRVTVFLLDGASSGPRNRTPRTRSLVYAQASHALEPLSSKNDRIIPRLPRPRTLGSPIQGGIETMKTLTFGLAALALVAGLAAAHQENYVQPNPGAGVTIAGVRTCPGEGEPTPEEPLYDPLGFTIGGIKYCGGHIAPDGAG